jgi:hypothetical protein
LLKLAISIALDLSGEEHGTKESSRAQSSAGLRSVYFFGRELAQEAVTRNPGYAPGIREMYCSLGNQAERSQALGGPWKLEEKANLLDSPFTLQEYERFDIFLLPRKNHRASR